MISKGNELLQELYERLTGCWYKKGKYKNEPFNQQEVKELLEKIIKEYNEYECADYKELNRTETNE